jgi:hypothetical protein
MTSIDIRAFDPACIDARRRAGSPPTCIIIGTRGKGKSWIARDIMYAVRSTPTGIVISGTEEGNDFYAQFVPHVFVHTEVRLETLKRIVDRQKKKPNKTHLDDVLVVLDDCMYDRSFTRDTVIRGIFMNGRHWKVMLLVTMQYCMDLPPSLRSNIDYVFLARETNPGVIDRLYRNFGAGFNSLGAFTDALNLCTADFGCMVIDNVAGRVWHHKATDHGEFRVFHKKAWQYSGRYACTSDATSRKCATAKDGTVIRCIRG